MGLCQSQPNIVINDGFHIRSRHAIVIGNRMLVPIGDKTETKKWISIDMQDHGKLKLVKSKRKQVHFNESDDSISP
jgi:hypothetical protein